MGQRVQLIIDLKIDDYENEGKTYRRMACYHNQWGIGKLIWKDVMCFLLTKKHITRQGYKFQDELSRAHLLDFTSDYLELQDFKTAKGRLKFFNEDVCNNNGAVILKLALDKYGYIKKGEIKIYAGYEESKTPFSKDISYREWFSLQNRGEYQDRRFDVSLLSLLDFYNVKIKY